MMTILYERTPHKRISCVCVSVWETQTHTHNVCVGWVFIHKNRHFIYADYTEPKTKPIDAEAAKWKTNTKTIMQNEMQCMLPHIDIVCETASVLYTSRNLELLLRQFYSGPKLPSYFQRFAQLRADVCCAAQSFVRPNHCAILAEWLVFHMLADSKPWCGCGRI